jgi:hypothetical protein
VVVVTGLQRAPACVIIKFDLPPAEAAYYAPAVTFCKLSNVRLGHFSENSQLCRLRHQVLGLDRQDPGDLHGESWEMLVHGRSGLTTRRAAHGCGNFFRRQTWLQRIKTDGRVFTGTRPMLARVIQVHVHLAGIGVRELSALEIDDNEAAELAMEEEQINPIPFVANAEAALTPDKSEIAAEFQKETLQVQDERFFDVGL